MAALARPVLCSPRSTVARAGVTPVREGAKHQAPSGKKHKELWEDHDQMLNFH